MSSTSRPKVLCIVAHFFGQSKFRGGSTAGANADRRKRVVKRTIAQIKRLSPLLEPDLCIYGFEGQSLVPIDVDVSSRVASPLHIPWAAFEDAKRHFQHYDFLLYLEDDILVPRRVLARMMAAAKDLAPREILFPNRVEFPRGFPIAVDLYYVPQWTGYSKRWRGRRWHEAVHPHSAMLFMSKEQIASVFDTTDFSNPRRTCFDFQASVLAEAHKGFRLLRERSVIPTHFVVHQDSWIIRNKTSMLRAIGSHLSGYRFGREPAQKARAKGRLK